MPIIGMSYLSRNSLAAAEVAVLQAMTTAFIPCSTKRFTMASDSSRTCSGDFVPYGAFAESPKYSTRSFGISRRISRATEIPPKPESKTPIGAVEAIRPPLLRLFRARKCHARIEPNTSIAYRV